jgi:hypothetical protein
MHPILRQFNAYCGTRSDRGKGAATPLKWFGRLPWWKFWIA